MFRRFISSRLVEVLFSVSVLFAGETYACNSEKSEFIEVISKDKISQINVMCLSFSGQNKELELNVLDVAKNDIKEIFSELYKANFPIYLASCLEKRTMRNGGRPSMHAYGAAIDINYLMNPHYDVINQNLRPGRKVNRDEDKALIESELLEVGLEQNEIDAVLNVVIQEEGSDDRFLNRNIIRKGMVTQEVVEIFRRHGFNIWGGMWRQPMDYMHFQFPRNLAEALSKEDDKEKRQKLWEEHIAELKSK